MIHEEIAAPTELGCHTPSYRPSLGLGISKTPLFNAWRLYDLVGLRLGDHSMTCQVSGAVAQQSATVVTYISAAYSNVKRIQGREALRERQTFTCYRHACITQYWMHRPYGTYCTQVRVSVKA